MSRNVYLKKKTLEEARKILFDNFLYKNFEYEKLAVPEAVGRVIAEPVTAKISSPNYHAAAMDGIAVNAEKTFGTSETNPKNLNIGEDAFYVNTGNIIPEGCNSVIMIEHINEVEKNLIQIETPAFPWQYIRKMGEDIVATERLFPQGHVITPYCIGALLSGGIFSIKVRKKPKILIIPTGSELVDWQKENVKELKPGRIIESNSHVLGALCEKYGAEFIRNNAIVDDLEKIKTVVNDASKKKYDLIIIIGGSAAGSEDYAKPAIKKLGEIYVHGVTIMPGKPVIIGKVNNKPIFGMPGYPVSSIVAFEQFVCPLILKMLGLPEEERFKVTVEPTRKIASRLGVEEFIRVKLGEVGNRIVATPLPKGSGNITSITEADGIIRIPNHIEGIKDNETTHAELLKSLSSIKNTIIIVGSHDNTLDVLADQVRVKNSNITISSSHVGSMGGIMAIKRNGCHIAGSHLLEPSDGTYNILYVKKYLPNIDVKIVNLVLRDQGFIIPKGNPKKINDIKDLCRNDISFINRQAGSGTRILLDYKLKDEKIDPEAITGYENEEYTHMSVAVSVLGGTVDVGLGIYAAAKALNLDFIPVVTEQYDLVIPEIYFKTEKIQCLLETIISDKFKKRVEKLGGYSTHKTGEIIL